MASHTIPGVYEAAARQFLRALRGKRSQRAFARRLGYRANPITDWESGRRYPTAAEGLRAAVHSGVDVASAMATFHSATLTRKGPGEFDIASWMDKLRGSTPLTALAARVGVSRFAIARWLAGQAQPRIADFFLYIDVTTGRLYDFVAALVNIEQVPALFGAYKAAIAIRRAAYDAPWTEAVMRVLECTPYGALETHREGFISRALGIPDEQEKRSLALLARLGLVRRRRGRYELIDEAAVDTHGDRGRVNQLLQHWADVAKVRVPTRSEPDLFAYSVSALSTADVARAREILRGAFREIQSLVAASKPSERVMLINLQLVMLDADLCRNRT